MNNTMQYSTTKIQVQVDKIVYITYKNTRNHTTYTYTYLAKPLQ